MPAEDRRLGWHPGVDPIAIARAVKQNVMHQRRVSGASTLAMQVARMQSPGRRTYLHKAQESIAALAITGWFGHEAVLRHYLRIAPYGNRCRGIAYASRRYFDKPVEDLSWAESAFLAALPQAPARMNPLVPQGRIAAEARARRILDILRDDATITEAEHARAIGQLAELVLPLPGKRTDEAMHAVLRLETLLAREQSTYAARPIVRTTLDLELQKQVSWTLADHVEKWERSGAGNAAAIVVDAQTLEVRAWVGSTDYFDRQHAGSIDYARVPRSPGSTLKPLFYGHALDRGAISPATILDDLRLADGAMANSDGRFLGPLLPRVALGNSRNIPATEVVESLGLDEAYDFLRVAGLHDGSVPASYFGRGLAIGNQPVTLESLVRAYSMFPGDGVMRDLQWSPLEARSEGKRVLSEDDARRVTQFLADPLARLPTFGRMGAAELPFAVAVKTGTSTGYRDAWTIAWTPRYLVGVWVGHPDWRPMRELGGIRSAAEIANDVLRLLHDDQTDGMADLSFPPPRGTHPVRLCAHTGRLAGETCEHVVTEWFHDGAGPSRPCESHVRVAIDRRNGLLATGRTPAEHVETRTFLQLGPRYASWAAESEIPSAPEETSPLDARTPSETWTATSAGAIRLAERPVTLRISTPAHASVILRDPEMPADMSTLPLEVVVDGPAKQVVWYVDGKPFEVVGHPFATRWTLAPGEHTFQARVPYREERSATVRVTVR
jgi:penicillin-binding protein 1C